MTVRVNIQGAFFIIQSFLGADLLLYRGSGLNVTC